MDMQNEDGATPLMLACQQDNIEHVTHLLTQKVDVNVTDYSGKTALHYCAENKDPTCSQLLLAVEKSLLNIKDNEGYSPLQLAVISGNIPMLEFLISQGADIDSTDKEGHTALHWATVCGHLDVVDFLHSNGADLSCQDIHHAYPVHYAAQMCGNKEEGADPKLGFAVLKKLLGLGVRINCEDQDARQPLLWAASSGSSEACKLLVKSGAKVEAGDKDGLTALHCAASRGHNDCMKTLINECGARVDSKDKTAGCTPLFYAITLGHVECTNTLLTLGADPSYQDRKGRSPAHCAAAKGSKGNLDQLIKWKSDLWLRNVKGEYPMNEAALAGQNEMVDYLLNIADGEDRVNVCNHDSRTSLHVAAMTNNLELVKILLRWKANINAVMKTKDQKEFTVLDVAKMKAHQEIVDYLLQYGALPIEKLKELRAKEEEKAKEEARRKEEAEREKEKEDKTEEDPEKRDDSKSPRDGKEKRQKSRERRKRRDKDGKTKRSRSRKGDRSRSQEKDRSTPRTPRAEEEAEAKEGETNDKQEVQGDPDVLVKPAEVTADGHAQDGDGNKDNGKAASDVDNDETAKVNSDAVKSDESSDAKGAKQANGEHVDNTDSVAVSGPHLGGKTVESSKVEPSKDADHDSKTASKSGQKVNDSSKQEKAKSNQKDADKSSQTTSNQGKGNTGKQQRKAESSPLRQQTSGKQKNAKQPSTSKQSSVKTSSQSQSPPRNASMSPARKEEQQKRSDPRKASPPRRTQSPNQRKSPERGNLNRQNTAVSNRGRTTAKLTRGPAVNGLTRPRNSSNRSSSDDLSRDSSKGKLQNGHVRKPLENGESSETDMSSYSSYTGTDSSTYNTSSYYTSRISEQSAETPRKNSNMSYIQESVRKFEQKRYAVRELNRLKRLQLYNAHLSEEIILKKIMIKQDENNAFKRKDNYQNLADWERYLYEEYQSSMQPLQEKKAPPRDPDEKRRIYEVPRSVYMSPPRQGSTPRGPHAQSHLSPNSRTSGPGSVRSSRSRDRSKSPPRVDDSASARKWRDMQDQKSKEQQEHLSKIYMLNLPKDLFDAKNRPISRRKPNRSFPPSATARSSSAQELTLHRPKSRSSSPLSGKTSSSSFPHLATESRTKRPETSQTARSSTTYSNSQTTKSHSKKQGFSKAQFNTYWAPKDESVAPPPPPLKPSAPDEHYYDEPEQVPQDKVQERQKRLRMLKTVYNRPVIPSIEITSVLDPVWRK